MRKKITNINDFLVMGLNYENNSYTYSDRYSHVCYKQLETVHEKETVPVLGIYTKLNEADPFKFVGTTSYNYLFVGNSKIVDSIISAISSSNMGISEQVHRFNSRLTWFVTRIVLTNYSTVRNIGDVYPCIDICNSYDGSKIATLSFGVTLNDNKNYMSFRQTLGAYSQKHIQGSKTRLINVIGGQIENINNNIESFVLSNTTNVITTETIVKTLDLVKTMGKRRYDAIHKYIAELISSNRAISSWDMFLAISKYTATERNLNARMLLENLIESVVIVPSEMRRAVGSSVARAA